MPKKKMTNSDIVFVELLLKKQQTSIFNNSLEAYSSRNIRILCTAQYDTFFLFMVIISKKDCIFVTNKL